jgi:putative ABC transport system permease protein
LRVAPAHAELIGDAKPALVLLMGTVGLVLLAACVNVASLLVARSVSRRKEIAVRAALGAGRHRLFQQLLTEGFLLAMLGVGAGLLVARWLVRLIPFLIPASLSLPGLDQVVIDGWVLVLLPITAGLVGLFFGCMPAWHLFQSSTPDTLSERMTTGGSGTGGYGLRSALLAAEVAFSLVLLLGAGLLLRSFANLMELEPGFRADRVLTMQLQLPEKQYGSPPQQAAFFRQVREHVQAIAGVESVAAIEYLPLSGSGVSRRMVVEGRPGPDPGEEPTVQRHVVTPDYFRALGIPLRLGRAFGDADMNPEPLVVVINEMMARRHWPNKNPVGQHLRLGLQGKVASSPVREVIGVVGDVRHSSLQADPRDQVYVPFGQDGWPVMHLIVRSSTVDPGSLITEVKSAVWAVDKNQPLPSIKPMTRIVADSVWKPRLTAIVLTLFGVLTLALVLSGIYGLTIQIVSGRTPEIGVRMALGARPSQVLILILRQGFVPVLIGLVGGLGCAVAGGQLIATQLYRISQTDPLTFFATVLLVAFTAMLAMAYPAWHASRVDPMVALRHE